jgi:hypothetical protein
VRFNRRQTKLDPRARSSARGFTILEITILTAILALVASLAVPNFLKARDRAARDLCIYNLGRIDSAKEAWALGVGGNGNFEPEPDDLRRFFSGELMPGCPAGGEYEIGLLHEPPFCTFESLGHIYLPDTHNDGISPVGGSSGPSRGGPPPWAGSAGGNGKP